MTSTFNVGKAGGYEQLMGRWSKQLAPLFINFAGLSDGERILDVGCGTGSLTFALPKADNVQEVAAIDFSPVFVEEANRLNTDPRIHIQQGDATSLSFPDEYFDRALALLVLHFVPKAARAIGEMRDRQIRLRFPPCCRQGCDRLQQLHSARYPLCNPMMDGRSSA